MLLWNVQEYKDGMFGSVAKANSYKLMVMPIPSGEEKDDSGKTKVIGYGFCIASEDTQPDSTSFMSVSNTIEEAQQQAEMTFLLRLLGALACFRGDTLNAFTEQMKFLLKPSLEEAFQLIEQLQERNAQIRDAIAKRVQAAQGTVPQQAESSNV